MILSVEEKDLSRSLSGWTDVVVSGTRIVTFSGILPDGRFQRTMYNVSPSGSLCDGKLPEGLGLAASGQ